MPHAHPNPILTLPENSFTRALAQMDPASRALLDLSLRRGMRPEEISDMLGTGPESVIVAREHALEQLAAELGMANVSELDHVRARLSELPADAWTPPPKLALVSESPESEAPPRAPEKPRRSRPLLLTLLGAAAVALVVVLASSGDDEPGTSAGGSGSPAPEPQAGKAQPAAPAPKVALVPMGAAGARVRGTASLTKGGKRLRIDVSGLPDPRGGRYQAWLYNSVVDARSLAAARGTKLQLDLKRPPAAAKWRLIDISLEPRDGNPNHSGRSVVRVPLAKLAR